MPREALVLLRVGSPDGRRTAGLDAATTREALRCLVTELVTVDRLGAALRSLPLEAAARAVIDATVEGQTGPDELVTALGVQPRGAQTLAFLRRVDIGESMLVDPLEVADQAQVGSGEFGYGWWEIRTTLADPAATSADCMAEGIVDVATRHRRVGSSGESGSSSPSLCCAPVCTTGCPG